MKWCKFLIEISPYLISEVKRYISSLWPSSVEPETLSKYVPEYERTSKWMVEFISKFQGRDIKTDRVNSKWRHHELSFSFRWSCIYLSI